MHYQLPNGQYTDDPEEYEQQWLEMGAFYETFGFKLYAFDPEACFYSEDGQCLRADPKILWTLYRWFRWNPVYLLLWILHYFGVFPRKSTTHKQLQRDDLAQKWVTWDGKTWKTPDGKEWTGAPEDDS